MLKYKSLCIEMQRMWNLKCTIIPVIIGATGIVTRSLRKNLEVVPGKHSIDSLQKTAILGTSHIIRKVLQCEHWSLSGGNHCWFKRITRKNRPVTREITTTTIIIIIIIINWSQKSVWTIARTDKFLATCRKFDNNSSVVQEVFWSLLWQHYLKCVRFTLAWWQECINIGVC